MYIVGDDFKREIRKLGRRLDVLIGSTITNNKVDYFNLSYDGGLLKSVMKKVELELKENLTVGSVVSVMAGLVWTEYDEEDEPYDYYRYVPYGDFIVASSEKNEDKDSYKIVLYDKMIYSMKDYEPLKKPTIDTSFVEDKKYYSFVDTNYVEYDGVTTGNPSSLGLYELNILSYPLTIRDYMKAICTHLQVDFKNKNSTFTNYDKTINNELYLDINGKSLGYTFRDVLDDIAEVTGSTICIDSYLDKIEIRYLNNTNVTIEETSLKDINVRFGEKFGPINSVVLSRSAESDNVYLRNETSVESNGLCEIKIVDNQIMNGNDRNVYLPELLNRLNGIEYYLNDYKSTGIMYLDVCDKYNVSIGDEIYNCVMFNDEVIIEQGLEENVYTKLPEQSETDYTKADTTDRRINQAYLMVDKQSGRIDGVVSDFNEYTTITDDELGKVKETTLENKSAITSLTATGGRLEVLEQRVSDNEKSFDNLVVEININGINVSTNDSAISTLIDNEKFVVMNNTTPLAFIGYDSSDGITKAEMEYLTVKTYFTVGHHRVEEFVDNYENRTGWFYIG